MIIIGIVLLVTGGMITYQYLQGNTQQDIFIPIIAVCIEIGGAGLIGWGLTTLNNTS